MLAWALVQEARRRARLTQRELAERAGTSQAAIARIERGRQDPSLETLQKILRACGLDLRIELMPHDGHDEQLLESTLALSPEDRLRAIEEVTRAAVNARPA